MVSLVSDTARACQCLDLLLYLVRDNSFTSWRIVLWFILDGNPLHMFGLLPTWFFLLQMKTLYNYHANHDNDLQRYPCILLIGNCLVCKWYATPLVTQENNMTTPGAQSSIHFHSWMNIRQYQIQKYQDLLLRLWDLLGIFSSSSTKNPFLEEHD